MRRLLAVLALIAGITAAAADAAAHFTITPPRGWRTVDITKVLDAAYLERVARENPSLVQYLRVLGQPNSPVKYFAYDPRVVARFATNLNVIEQQLPAGETLNRYAADSIAQLRSFAPLDLRQSRVRLPGGRAVRLAYGLRQTGRRLSIVQYLLVARGRAYVLTFTTLPALLQKYVPVFARSARTFRTR